MQSLSQEQQYVEISLISSSFETEPSGSYWSAKGVIFKKEDDSAHSMPFLALKITVESYTDLSIAP